MKKIKLVFILCTTICIIVSLFFAFKKHQEEQLLNAIYSNFHIKSGTYGHEGNTEVNIFNDGKCIYKSDFADESGSKPSKKTYIPVDELHKYLTYAVKKGFFKLNSSYRTEEKIFDPTTSKLEITIGSLNYSVADTHSDNKLIKEIQMELIKILYKYKVY